MPVALALLACSGPSGPTDGHSQDTDTDTVPPDTGPTTTVIDTGTTDTGTTTTDPLPAECDDLPTGPYTFVASDAIQTEEDFDFDIDGRLIAQSWQDLVGITTTGDISIVASNVGEDIAGIRSLPTGDILATNQNTGTVRFVDHATGAATFNVTGIAFPNGLEVGTDGMAYVSDYVPAGNVRTWDPYDPATVEIIVELPYPNGIALSPDEQTLYIATADNYLSGTGHVAAIDRNPDGSWDPTPRLVYEAGSLLDAIAVDVCGNLYLAEYGTGRVVRVRLDGTVENLVDLDGSMYSAARFGPGIGGWDRKTLYVSNRSQITAIEIGVDGRHVLAVDEADTGG